MRRCELSVPELFSTTGRYAYTGGVNRRAIGALCVAIAPVVPGFVRAALTPGGQVADPTLFDVLYTYAWFVTFVVAAAVYLAMTPRERLALSPA